MKKIGVLTSGGDAPGMNAAIRAVVRKGNYHSLEIYGIYNGYEGLLNGWFERMHNNSVSNIIQRGGTILKSARSTEFQTPEGMERAYRNFSDAGLDALVVIGGDGTFRGALEFGGKYDIPIMGLPGTIDNDLYGTDYTIGYNTALNTVMEAVDKIRDTASSHERLFFIEVMGRDAGFIALRSGIAVGAEDILIPETETCIDDLIQLLDTGWRNNKRSAIIIVAEGDDAGGAYEVAEKVNKKFSNYKTRVTVLGHIQRGGAPCCTDRVLASVMGYYAVEALIAGRRDEMVGIVNKEVNYVPFESATKHHNKINSELLKIARVLST